MPTTYLCDGRSFIEMGNDGGLHTAFTVDNVTFCDVIFSLQELKILYDVEV